MVTVTISVDHWQQLLLEWVQSPSLSGRLNSLPKVDRVAVFRQWAREQLGIIEIKDAAGSGIAIVFDSADQAVMFRLKH